MSNLFRQLVARSCSTSCSAGAKTTKSRLRSLLRETAQPVAVVTSFMSPDASLRTDEDTPKYHGATLSSFTSIAMDPVPLVSFALRIPSRMASSLNSSSSSDMVINLLCAGQASVATSFSRPDLHPRPFATTPYFLNAEGLPVIQGSLGAISCKLVSRGVPLHDLPLLFGGHEEGTPPKSASAEVVSELFIAQVTRVEVLEVSGDDRPLLYHRRRFTSILDGI
ncbi:flavin reductase like domain-containing protein [Mycena metata]|uniref:Flavin reductase like domain-containing protein n=1 Tax=Mycena metata TaxID=1033252 RepID=A0AAD7K2W6_9AGAR|nr:flavin reductase like domain-containing protein [Mycena metata]